MVVPFQKPLTKCIKVGLRHLSYCIGMPPLVVLLGFAVSWTGFRYAQFVSSLTTNSRSASINHIFLLNTFIYRNSTTFGTRNHDTLVAFFITPEGTESRFAYCAAEDALTNIEQGIPATVSLLSESQNCRMNAYVLHCPLEIVRSIRQRISAPIGIGFLGSPPVKVLPTDLSVRRHTSLVFCMGQLFGFERWPALLAALELHRYLGVERVILYIHTVSSHIFQLLQEFADTYPEFLDIRPTLNLPQSMDLDFDPNMEVEDSYERFHQYICLFEHRENSEFVALLEPENVLIPSETFSPPGELLNILRKIAAQNMKTVLFTPNFAHGLCSNSACNSQLSVELETIINGIRFGPTSKRIYTKNILLIIRPAQMNGMVELEKSLISRMMRRKRRRSEMDFKMNTNQMTFVELSPNSTKRKFKTRFLYNRTLADSVNVNALKRGIRFWNYQKTDESDILRNYWQTIRRFYLMATNNDADEQSGICNAQWLTCLFWTCFNCHRKAIKSDVVSQPTARSQQPSAVGSAVYIARSRSGCSQVKLSLASTQQKSLENSAESSSLVWMMQNFSETSNEEFPKSKEKAELSVAPTQQMEMGSDFEGNLSKIKELSIASTQEMIASIDSRGNHDVRIELDSNASPIQYMSDSLVYYNSSMRSPTKYNKGFSALADEFDGSPGVLKQIDSQDNDDMKGHISQSAINACITSPSSISISSSCPTYSSLHATHSLSSKPGANFTSNFGAQIGNAGDSILLRDLIQQAEKKLGCNPTDVDHELTITESIFESASSLENENFLRELPNTVL